VGCGASAALLPVLLAVCVSGRGGLGGLDGGGEGRKEEVSVERLEEMRGMGECALRLCTEATRGSGETGEAAAAAAASRLRCWL
jgi:hypothetical protein